MPFMVKKELIKQLIVDFQQELPAKVFSRELCLPTDSDKIITVPGVRRCGKSTLLLLSINRLLTEGISREHILFLNFDDERLQFNADNLDEILQAYRELYPHIPLRDAYLFFDEIQMAQDWEQFVRRVYERECKHIFLTATHGCSHPSYRLHSADELCSTKSFRSRLRSIVVSPAPMSTRILPPARRHSSMRFNPIW